MSENLLSIRAGSTFIHQGETGHSAYIIESGRVEIYIEKPGRQPQIVGTRGASVHMPSRS